MIAELNELKWLLLPLYPVVVLLSLIGWVVYATKGRRRVALSVKLLGMQLSVSYGEHELPTSLSTPLGGQ